MSEGVQQSNDVQVASALLSEFIEVAMKNVKQLFDSLSEIELIDYEVHGLCKKVHEKYSDALADLDYTCRSKIKDFGEIQSVIAKLREISPNDASGNMQRFTTESNLGYIVNLQHWSEFCDEYHDKAERMAFTDQRAKEYAYTVAVVADYLADFSKDTRILIKAHLSELPDFVAKYTEAAKEAGLEIKDNFVSWVTGLLTDTSIQLTKGLYKQISAEAKRQSTEVDSLVERIVYEYLSNPQSQANSNEQIKQHMKDNITDVKTNVDNTGELITSLNNKLQDLFDSLNAKQPSDNAEPKQVDESSTVDSSITTSTIAANEQVKADTNVAEYTFNVENTSPAELGNTLDDVTAQLFKSLGA